MKKQTHQQIEEAAASLQFINYSGPAGHPLEQVNTNTNALGQYLESVGVSVEYSTLADLCLGIADEEDMVLIKVGTKYASYDRWGFVAGDDFADDLDQASFAKTVEYLIPCPENCACGVDPSTCHFL
jgi:hypothetical protein